MNPFGLTASKERSKRLHLRKSSAADIANDCAICRTNAQHCCLQQIVERRRSFLRYFGEKEHTSKRVSIIAPDNAISKAQCATCISIKRKSPMNTGLQAHRTSSFVTQNHPLTQALTQILFVPERLWILFCFWLSITRQGQSLSFCGRRVRLP